MYRLLSNRETEEERIFREKEKKRNAKETEGEEKSYCRAIENRSSDRLLCRICGSSTEE